MSWSGVLSCASPDRCGVQRTDASNWQRRLAALGSGGNSGPATSPFDARESGVPIGTARASGVRVIAVPCASERFRRRRNFFARYAPLSFAQCTSHPPFSPCPLLVALPCSVLRCAVRFRISPDVLRWSQPPLGSPRCCLVLLLTASDGVIVLCDEPK